MKKPEIIKTFLPNLKNKNKFLQFSKNNYFRFIKDEAMFQFFVVHILRENNYHVICNNYESRKTPFEQYQSIHLGNERGIPDIYTTECLKSVKGAYFELKSDIDKVYTKKLILRNNNHIVEQKNMLDRLSLQGFVAIFLYPENVQETFLTLFNINLK